MWAFGMDSIPFKGYKYCRGNSPAVDFRVPYFGTKPGWYQHSFRICQMLIDQQMWVKCPDYVWSSCDSFAAIWLPSTKRTCTRLVRGNFYTIDVGLWHRTLPIILSESLRHPGSSQLSLTEHHLSMHLGNPWDIWHLKPQRIRQNSRQHPAAQSPLRAFDQHPFLWSGAWLDCPGFSGGIVPRGFRVGLFGRAGIHTCPHASMVNPLRIGLL